MLDLRKVGASRIHSDEEITEALLNWAHEDAAARFFSDFIEKMWRLVHEEGQELTDAQHSGLCNIARAFDVDL